MNFSLIKSVQNNKAFYIFFVASLLLCLALGAPWQDLDALYYQHMAEHISGHVFQSRWYPVGLPILIRLFHSVGFSVLWISVFTHTFRFYINYLIYKKYFTSKISFALTIFTQGFTWLAIGTMLKAESMFLTSVLGMVLCLQSNNKNTQLWGTWAFFIFALLFRHAGLFLFPALSFSFWHLYFFRFRKLSQILILVISGMFISNFINSGNPLRPSKESFACMHFIGAASSFDYCCFRCVIWYHEHLV
jgi:hypothetical protein